MRQLDLSIIIVSWNTRDLLAQCLDSVTANLPDAGCEIWVVDNASSDASAAMVQDLFPQVYLIENRENVGFARANNQAIRASSGKFILLLNSDTIVHKDALGKMVSFLGSHPDAGIVGANTLNPDGTPQFCYGSFPTLLSESASAWGVNSHMPFCLWWRPRLGIESEFLETDWVVGAGLMVRRRVLDQVGLLDEAYFMYSEEIDLAYRVKKAGWKNYVLRAGRITHLGQASSRQIPAAMKAELFRSKVKYFRKHHGEFSAQVLNLVYGASVLAKARAYGLAGMKSQANLWSEAWEYYRGRKTGPSGTLWAEQGNA